MLTTAIGTKITEMREQKGKILLKRKSESILTYGLEEAVQEVLAFHDSCSFRMGLQVALAEGTQTTTDVKRAQLEAKAILLMNQIRTYAETKKPPIAYSLEPNGDNKITDPFLRSLVDQYRAVSNGIQALLPESSAQPKGVAGTSEAPTPETPPKDPKKQ
jgi:hypothetical protein